MSCRANICQIVLATFHGISIGNAITTKAADLNGLALVHHHDLVGKGQRLNLIVRHIDHQEIERPMNSLQLRPKLPLKRGADHRQRFVEQDGRHIRTNQAAPQRDLLLGVGGETAGAPVQNAGQIKHRRDLGDPPLDRSPWKPSVLQREGEIFGDRHRVVDDGKLEHLRDVPFLGWQMRHVDVVKQQAPFRWNDEPGNDVEQGRLAAARWPQRALATPLA